MATSNDEGRRQAVQYGDQRVERGSSRLRETAGDENSRYELRDPFPRCSPGAAGSGSGRASSARPVPGLVDER